MSDKLKEKGFKPVLDAHCITCHKPINSEVDGFFCSVRCQAFTDNESDDSWEPAGPDVGDGWEP